MMGRQMEKICKEFREEGRVEGRVEGREEGRVEGLEEGRKEGTTKTLVKLVRSGRITAIEAAEELGISVESFRELMADNA